MLHQAVHSCNADGGEQAADGCGDEADQERHQHKDGLGRTGINGKGLQRYHGQKKYDSQTGE